MLQKMKQCENILNKKQSLMQKRHFDMNLLWIEVANVSLYGI